MLESAKASLEMMMSEYKMCTREIVFDKGTLVRQTLI